ncbi:hypothetical protein GCM10027419_08310 [Pandoraea terrae]
MAEDAVLYHQSSTGRRASVWRRAGQWVLGAGTRPDMGAEYEAEYEAEYGGLSRGFACAVAVRERFGK